MNITTYIVSERESGLLLGDYNVYRAQTSRRIHALRKRLGQTTPKGKKYTARSPITAEDIGRDNEFVNLFIMCAERAWAAAMAMKSTQSAETTQKKMAGSTKRQIVSRLNKATQYAELLVNCLTDITVSRANNVDVLEAAAYLATLQGASYFEKSKWAACIQKYSVSRVIYATVGSDTRTDLFKELLSSTVDPSIRYAAYQSKYSRTKAVSDIAIEHFPSDESHLRKQVESIDANAFTSSRDVKLQGKEVPGDIPASITWRQRTVEIEDATIAQATAVADQKEGELIRSNAKDGISAKELAAAYDEVINARQEASDATKLALDELTGEGVDTSDARVQSLQVIKTAVNYAVIELRIGRSRVLCGADDGIYADRTEKKHSPRVRKDVKIARTKESTGAKRARLRERVALYNSILQNIDAVTDLSGVTGDSAFMKALSGKRAYFRALRCLAIGESHALAGETINALALYVRSEGLTRTAVDSRSGAPTEAAESPPKLGIDSQDLQRFHRYIDGLVSQYRALVELKNLLSEQKVLTQHVHKPPLVERLDKYPSEDIDLAKLVSFPPKLELVPVEPLLYDLAWNYIDYPGRSPSAVNGAPTAPKTAVEEKKEPAKKGWFGFGR